jgi:ATP-binding cassette subfamily B (MDR/TAP) protein 1
VLGFLGAAINGSIMPLFSIVFGDLVNDIGGAQQQAAVANGTSVSIGNSTAADPFSGLSTTVGKLSLKFLGLGLGTLLASWLGMGSWITASQRMTFKLRSLYLKSVLRQEVVAFSPFCFYVVSKLLYCSSFNVFFCYF